jgi:NTP pyrophosphatase (non-canonical NTP hydrolase)
MKLKEIPLDQRWDFVEKFMSETQKQLNVLFMDKLEVKVAELPSRGQPKPNPVKRCSGDGCEGCGSCMPPPPPEHLNINAIAEDIYGWANDTFPHRTPQAMFLKLYGEIAEMIEAGDMCGDEVADVMILVLDHARKMGVNPAAAIARKMAINRKRQWQIGPGGVFSHVK